MASSSHIWVLFHARILLIGLCGCDVAQDVGTDTFKFADGKKVQARYTYVYEQQDGKRLITRHHCSAKPEQPIR